MLLATATATQRCRSLLVRSGVRSRFLPRTVARRGCNIVMATASGATNVLVVAGPGAPELEVLKDLPENVHVAAVGKSSEDFAHLTDSDWAAVTVLLNCGVGKHAGTKADLQRIWPKLPNLKWLHSASAGLEHLLFPELVESPVVLTNAKGVYSHSLAEYTLACCNWFAKDFRRLLAAKKGHEWDPYDVEELRSRTFGVVGYGDIGQACARLAKAFKMRVVALRRRTALTEAEKQEGILDALYSPDQLNQLMAESDYVVVATPYTPSTHHLVNAGAIAAMKPTGVLVNVGRGKCIEEPALIEALQQHKIRGAALDVFYTEPLPEDSPIWDLDNVFMSPHCADRTTTFQHESLRLFVENVRRHVAGLDLLNVCDKTSGY